MQTFLPYSDFTEIAKCLDDKRLGAMRREAQQTLDTIYMRPTKKGTPRKGYVNHPILNLWRGYENALQLYINSMIDEWVSRGKNNTMVKQVVIDPVMPPWLGFEPLHSAHRSQLHYKNPEHYQQFDWPEADEPLKDYVWDWQKCLREKTYASG